MSKLKRWNGSSWVTVPDGSAVKYWNGSNWVVPSAVRYWTGSTWAVAWAKADPKTLTFYANFTTNLRHSGGGALYDSTGTAANDAAADLYIGRYGGSYPYHFLSLIGFGLSNYGTSLAAELAARPVIKSASLRLYRLPGAGLGSPSGTLSTGIWTQSGASNLPATTLSGTYNDWSTMSTTSINGWSYDTAKWFNVYGGQIQDLAAGKVLAISEVTSGYTSSGGTTNAYSRLYGLASGFNSSKTPLLQITLDYV